MDSNASKQVSVIIPAYNEADIIGDTVKAALRIPNVSEVLVVDDGSTDKTAEVAKIAGAHSVIRSPKNMGKGDALNSAWRQSKGQILLLLDADLGKSAAEAGLLLDPVLNDQVDMTIAWFRRPSDPCFKNIDGSPNLSPRSGGFGIVVKTARLGIWLLTRRWIQSPLSGPRALRREILDRIGGFAKKFGVEVGLTVDALRIGYRIMEVPVSMVHRPSGRDLKGIRHRGRQMADVIVTLAKRAMRI